MDYIGSCRSNYFAVKDEEEFKRWCERTHLTFTQGNPKEFIFNGKRYNYVGFYKEDGGLPSIMDDENGDAQDVEFMEELRKHLIPGSVAIVQEVGSEGMRYLTGYAMAINSKGKIVSIGIEDIIDKARKLTNKPGLVTPCQY